MLYITGDSISCMTKLSVTLGGVSLVLRQASASFKASLRLETFKELVYCDGWPVDENPH